MVKRDSPSAAVQPQELTVVAFRRQLAVVQLNVATEEVDRGVVTGAAALRSPLSRHKLTVVELHVAANPQLGDDLTVVVADAVLTSGNLHGSAGEIEGTVLEHDRIVFEPLLSRNHHGLAVTNLVFSIGSAFLNNVYTRY